MHSITIKRAVEQDAEHLTHLMRESKAYQGIYASIVADYPVTGEYVARHRVFKAVGPEEQLLGFYSLMLEPPELDLAFVSNDVQRMGIGRRLIAHMLDQARQAGAAAVRVVSHPKAEWFYRTLGAERVGSVPPAPPRTTWERPELRFVIA